MIKKTKIHTKLIAIALLWGLNAQTKITVDDKETGHSDSSNHVRGIFFRRN
jgi:hypothetical protein